MVSGMSKQAQRIVDKLIAAKSSQAVFELYVAWQRKPRRSKADIERVSAVYKKQQEYWGFCEAPIENVDCYRNQLARGA